MATLVSRNGRLDALNNTLSVMSESSTDPPAASREACRFVVTTFDMSPFGPCSLLALAFSVPAKSLAVCGYNRVRIDASMPKTPKYFRMHICPMMMSIHVRVCPDACPNMSKCVLI